MTTTPASFPTAPAEHAATRSAHWDSMACHWRRLGPPLRPSPAEVQHFQRAITLQSEHSGQTPLRVVMLGVTPEIAQLNWPAGANVLAVDRSPEMVRAVWPGDRPERRALCSDWITALTSAAPLDTVIGDCSLTSQQYPHEWNRLIKATASALTDSGQLILRCRTSPERSETPEQVFEDLLHGRIASFHSFKLRLAIALQPAPGAGVVLHDVWRCWSRAAITPEDLHAATGWPLEIISTIELYRNKPACLTFPSLRQIRELIGTRFSLESVTYHTDELRAQHPLFEFSRR